MTESTDPTTTTTPANGHHPASSSESGLSTQALHAGVQRDRAFHSVTSPIIQTSAYTFEDTAAVADFKEKRMRTGDRSRQEYGRYGNPTVRAVEQRLAALDGGEDAMLVSSGMAAVTTALLILLSAGDHLIVTDDSYHKTRVFVNTFLSRFGVECTTVSADDLAGLESAIQPNTRLILSETPTNPFLRCIDLEALANIARRHDVLTLIDSTFATPLNMRPLEFGIDLVTHSVTKYLAGHNDLLAGVITGSREHIDQLGDSQGMFGAVVDPSTAYNIGRGLKTLGLRVERQNTSGMAIANYLESHPKVRLVWYPGLPSHPDHAIARKQMRGYGGVVSFEIDGDGAAASRFVDAMRLPYVAPSLGGVDSLIILPAVMSYYETPPAERLALGVRDELVRFAIGIEEPDDIIADLAQALTYV